MDQGYTKLRAEWTNGRRPYEPGRRPLNIRPSQPGVYGLLSLVHSALNLSNPGPYGPSSFYAILCMEHTSAWRVLG